MARKPRPGTGDSPLFPPLPDKRFTILYADPPWD